jgi:hypothetical protein
VDQLGSEITVIRSELDGLLGELDRRRHDAVDVGLQLRRHAMGAALTIVALAATAAGSVWLGRWRRRRRNRLGARAGRVRHALARMTAHPERVAAEPTAVQKIAVAAANAALAGVIRKLLERGLEAVRDAGRARPALSAGSGKGDDAPRRTA